eukprot:TRINITY_DN22474_c0_g1_i1.p1 TRINITY_DN22474_c0_g1~~TRINITY_DN22474_c0_g1_i1.p1  ORF type:complete len:797 (+),score=131.05 TRINITY_DN22474_c0_g1_i1:51-2441(+)
MAKDKMGITFVPADPRDDGVVPLEQIGEDSSGGSGTNKESKESKESKTGPSDRVSSKEQLSDPSVVRALRERSSVVTTTMSGSRGARFPFASIQEKRDSGSDSDAGSTLWMGTLPIRGRKQGVDAKWGPLVTASPVEIILNAFSWHRGSMSDARRTIRCVESVCIFLVSTLVVFGAIGHAGGAGRPVPLVAGVVIGIALSLLLVLRARWGRKARCAFQLRHAVPVLCSCYTAGQWASISDEDDCLRGTVFWAPAMGVALLAVTGGTKGECLVWGVVAVLFDVIGIVVLEVGDGNYLRLTVVQCLAQLLSAACAVCAAEAARFAQKREWDTKLAVDRLCDAMERLTPCDHIGGRMEKVGTLWNALQPFVTTTLVVQTAREAEVCWRAPLASPDLTGTLPMSSPGSQARGSARQSHAIPQPDCKLTHLQLRPRDVAVALVDTGGADVCSTACTALTRELIATAAASAALYGSGISSAVGDEMWAVWAQRGPETGYWDWQRQSTQRAEAAVMFGCEVRKRWNLATGGNGPLRVGLAAACGTALCGHHKCDAGPAGTVGKFVLSTSPVRRILPQLSMLARHIGAEVLVTSSIAEAARKRARFIMVDCLEANDEPGRIFVYDTVWAQGYATGPPVPETLLFQVSALTQRFADGGDVSNVAPLLGALHPKTGKFPVMQQHLARMADICTHSMQSGRELPVPYARRLLPPYECWEGPNWTPDRRYPSQSEPTPTARGGRKEDASGLDSTLGSQTQLPTISEERRFDFPASATQTEASHGAKRRTDTAGGGDQSSHTPPLPPDM